jgi:hypothetical protein
MATTAKTKTQEGAILSTTDYDIFKGVLGNRPIHEPHVDRVRRSIEKKNMLPRNPMKVNQNMEIIDGQHRLEAAKQLQLPIYYMIEPDAGLEEIQLLQTTRTWLTSDYLDSFIAMKKRDYIILKEFAEEYRISISIAMQVLSQRFNSRTELLRDFREGNFQIADYERAQAVASLIGEVRRHSPDYSWTHRECIRALALLQEKVDPKMFTEQLSRYQLVVTRRQSVRDYLRQFENIINANREGKAIFLS